MINQKEFKNCMSNLASSVSIALTHSGDHFTGVTINTFTSLSLDPMLVLFNLKKSSFCYKDFFNSKKFAINILSASQQETSNIFTSELSKNDWENIELLNQNLPCFKGAIAYLECETHKIYDGGSHSIIVGEVKLIKELDTTKKPLIYYNRNYHSVNK